MSRLLQLPRLRGPVVRYLLALTCLACACETGYSAVLPGLDLSETSHGNKAGVGNFITAAGKWNFVTSDGDTATLKKIEVKLQVLVAGKYQDAEPYQLCDFDMKGNWSSPVTWINIPPGDYKVFVRMTFDQVVGGTLFQDKEFSAEKNIIFTK